MSTRPHIPPTRAGNVPRPGRSTDVVDPSAVLAERLRRAVGFRVDGPEGRVGTLRALVPGDLGAEPRLRVDVGLFIRREVGVPLRDVREVDPDRRRVLVASVPRIPRRGRAELARRVRRFLHASGAGPTEGP
jgi:hypothetical protein